MFDFTDGVFFSWGLFDSTLERAVVFKLMVSLGGSTGTYLNGDLVPVSSGPNFVVIAGFLDDEAGDGLDVSFVDFSVDLLDTIDESPFTTSE